MTRVEFYSNAVSKLQAACRLAALAFQQRARVVIYAPDESSARDIDKLLWTYQATGFVPHCMASDGIASETPIVISTGNGEVSHHQVILNLHKESPPLFSRFERLIEIVGSNEEDRLLARTRFRFYRDRGYEIHHHDLSKSEI